MKDSVVEKPCRKGTGVPGRNCRPLLAAISLALAATSAQAQVFINELHYDNASTDTGEMVELAGPAGTSLAGWTVALYNGSASQLNVYDTIALSGTFADQAGGMGTLAFARAGIQNGSPDGLALVNASNTVVQFLSYEGVFTAASGPADGMTSTDIGVEEGSGTPAGHSLQLVGAGSTYDDFTWAEAMAETPGQPNTGQDFGGEPAAPELLLSEMVVTPTGGEFIEIFNPGASSVDLSDVYLTDATFASGNTYYYNIVLAANAGGGGFSDFHARFPAGASIPAGGFQTVALAGSEAFFAEYGVQPTYELFEDGAADAIPDMREALPGSINGQGGLTNSGEVLVLYQWDGASDRVADLDYVVWGDKAEAVDKTGVALDGPDGDTLVSEYAADTPIASQDVISAGAHPFGESFTRIDFTEGNETQSGGNGVNGADETSENLSVTWASRTPSPNSDYVPPTPDLVITEVMQNPSAVSDGSGEWFEIHNAGDVDVDINGWTIADLGSDSHVINAGGPLVVPAGGYMVLGNNADSNTNGGLVVDYAYSGVFLANGDDELVLFDAAGFEVDGIAWDGGPVWPDPTGASMALTDLALDNNDGNNWCESQNPYGDGDRGTPGVANSCEVLIPEFGACGDAATKIHAVQGNGLASPIAGSPGVIIEGVVVGDFQGGDRLNGFFVQEEPADVDGDPATSEGIFVYDENFGVDVNVGDVVRVQGTVIEYFDLTEISPVINLVTCGTGTADTQEILLPLAGPDALEALEGMSVHLPQTLFVTDNFTLGRYGEVGLALGGPLDIPTNVVAPGAAAQALQAQNDLSRIQLDDGSGAQNPVPVPPYFAPDGTLRVGDATSAVTGVLGYGFGEYEVHPTDVVAFSRENERPTEAPDVGNPLVTVAGFNVLNYFITLDDNTPVCGPSANMDCRGAENAFEFERQRAKVVAALSLLGADVVGLVEVENAAGDGPVADLVDGLNDILGADTYAYIATGAIGTDAIRQALIYRPDAVTPVGGFETLDSSDDPDFIDTANRPALAQSFVDGATGEVFTVAVNHLKSKGSDCDALGDPDTGDGQGNCNLTRAAAASALANWLAGDPTGSGSARSVIIGDLNAYAMEDPIVVLKDAGFVDLVEVYNGVGYADGAYSYGFGGQMGYLDHALASAAFAADTSGAAAWHINADEPSALDYNDYNQASLLSPDPYRASDHDAVVIGLFNDEDDDGVWDTIDACPATVIPEAPPTKGLGNNRFALLDDDGVFDTTEGGGPGVSFTIHDTAGCSCEQIIAAAGLGNGHTKFGCSIGEMRDWVSAQ